MRKVIYLVGMSALISGCAPTSKSSPVADFHANIQTLCGQSFLGKVTSSDPQDEDWRKVDLTLGPIECVSQDLTSMALAVGEDESRVWSLKLIEDDTVLEFRHAHTLKDGSPDPVTEYGGYARSPESTSTHLVVPVDEASKKVFAENGLQASMTNTWTLTLQSDGTLVYELTREGRQFTAEFDISQPIN